MILFLPPCLSLSFLPRLAVQPALLPSLPHSRAFPSEAESEGPPGLGAMTSVWGMGCAAQGSMQSTGHQREAGHQDLSQLCCDQHGTQAGATLPRLICLLSLTVITPALSAPGWEPCPDPGLVTDLLSLGPSLPSAKPVFSSINGCRRLREARTRQGAARPSTFQSFVHPSCTHTTRA